MRGRRNSEDATGPAGRPRRVLVLGAVQVIPELARELSGAVVVIGSYEAITAELIGRNAPDMVLAPLVAAEYDITDLAERLVRAGFRGRLRAYTRRLPDPRMVRAELRAGWPELEVDLIELRGG